MPAEHGGCPSKTMDARELDGCPLDSRMPALLMQKNLAKDDMERGAPEPGTGEQAGGDVDAGRENAESRDNPGAPGGVD